jgi:hypothetical protein
MQNSINDGDPRQTWIAHFGDRSGRGHTTMSERDPRAGYVQRLQDAWRQRIDDDDDEDDDNATSMKHNDALRFRDGSSLDAIPSGLPTGTTLRLMREQRQSHFGGAA